MRGVEKEGKMPLDPLFPRLHIDCTEQGGPRAPPRNKMALSGQVNTPSQRLSSGAMLMPRPTLLTSHDTNLVHGHCQNMNGYPLFRSTPEASSHKPGRLQPNCLDGMKADVECRGNQIFRSGYYKPLNARRALRMTRPYRYCHSLNSSAKLHLPEEDPGIPYFGRKENVLNGGMVSHRMEKAHCNSSNLLPLEQHKTTFGRHERIERTNPMSREHLENQYEKRDKKGEIFHPIPSSDHNVSANADLGIQAVHKNVGSCDRGLATLHHIRDRFRNGFSKLLDSSAQIHLEGRSLQVEDMRIVTVSGDPERLLRKRCSTTMEEVPMCSSSSTKAGVNNRSSSRIESANENPRGEHCKILPSQEVEGSCAILDTSVVDSSSCLYITPDVMMRVIGPNFFWRIRTTIDHQQRVFATQIFELHRLIKVQRLIAGSPKMIVEGNVIFSKPSAKLFTNNKLQMKVFPEPPSQSLKPKVESAQLEPCPDYEAEHAQVKLPATEDQKKGIFNLNSAIKSESFFPDDTKFGPCTYKPPSGAYQWLVPVRSPSEGLLYKPYSRPYPPPSHGSVASVYGSHGTTLSLTRMDATAYFNTTTYVFPALNQQQGIVIYAGPGAFTHAPEMINISKPDSAVMQQFGTTQSSSVQYIIPHRSSCNSSQESGTITDSGVISPVFRDGDFQGSPEEGLSLFPTAPVDQMLRYSNQNHQDSKKIQVIKVVPHNSSKSASESAARIFQRIQEERKIT